MLHHITLQRQLTFTLHYNANALKHIYMDAFANILYNLHCIFIFNYGRVTLGVLGTYQSFMEFSGLAQY